MQGGYATEPAQKMAQPRLEFLTSQRCLYYFYHRLVWQPFVSQVAMEQASMKGVEKSV